MDIYKNRRLVAKLAKNDFKTRYAGSYLGIVWAFIQPVITILVYWFVFSVGFRSGTGDLGVPFVLYLVAGIVPWFFFQAVRRIREYVELNYGKSYLSESEQARVNRKFCTGIHKNCNLYLTDGILQNPMIKNNQYRFCSAAV